LLDYWPLNRLQAVLSTSDSQVKWRSIRRLIEEKLLLFALAGVFSVIVYLVAQKANTVLSSIPLDWRIANALRSYVLYIWKMIWPWDLSILYPLFTYLPIWQIICSIMILTVITLFILWMRKKLPFLIVGWLWYLSTFLPVIGIIQNGGQAYADRYTYIPLIGVFIIIAWSIPKLIKNLPYRQIILGLGTATLLITLIIITRIQVGYWQNSETLWTRTLSISNDNYYAHERLASVLAGKGQIEDAIFHQIETIRKKLHPYFTDDLKLFLMRLDDAEWIYWRSDIQSHALYIRTRKTDQKGIIRVWLKSEFNKSFQLPLVENDLSKNIELNDILRPADHQKVLYRIDCRKSEYMCDLNVIYGKSGEILYIKVSPDVWNSIIKNSIIDDISKEVYLYCIS
ncbi:MAG: hypothetical protein ABSB79_05085, partial [Syntrophales bacterium]